MIGLDTNVLVRYLAGDPDTEAQVIQAVQRIDRALQEGTSLFVSHVVICETCWVLLYHYKVPKQKLIPALETLIQHPGFQFESRDTLDTALMQFREHSIDFADCLINVVSRNLGCTQILSFDKKAISSLKFQQP